jgi:hypothetical protein
MLGNKGKRLQFCTPKNDFEETLLLYSMLGCFSTINNLIKLHYYASKNQVTKTW